MGRKDGDDGRRGDAGRGVAPPALRLQGDFVQPAMRLANGKPRISAVDEPQLRCKEREECEGCEECERNEGWCEGW